MSGFACTVCSRPWRTVTADRASALYLQLAPFLRIVQVSSSHGRALYLPARPINTAVVAGRAACDAWPLHYWLGSGGLSGLAWGDRDRAGAMPSLTEFLAAYALRVAPRVVPEAHGAPSEAPGGWKQSVAALTFASAGAGGRAPAPANFSRVAA